MKTAKEKAGCKALTKPMQDRALKSPRGDAGRERTEGRRRKPPLLTRACAGLLLCALAAAPARGAYTVTGLVNQVTSQALDTYFMFTPWEDVLLLNNGLSAGPAKTVQSTNGVLWVTLDAGSYLVRLPRISGRNAFTIAVPNGTATANITNLIALPWTYQDFINTVSSSGVTNNQVLTGTPTSTNANFAGTFTGTFTGNAAGLTNGPWVLPNTTIATLNGTGTNTALLDATTTNLTQRVVNPANGTGLVGGRVGSGQLWSTSLGDPIWSLTPNSVTVYTNATFERGVIFNTPPIGSGAALTNLNPQTVLEATNTPTRSIAASGARTPYLNVNAWYTYSALPGISTATNVVTTNYNFIRWFTNLIYHFSTNGMLAAGWDSIATDGGWSSSYRYPDGSLSWNSNIFDNFNVPLTSAINFAHTNGFKVYLYGTMTTQHCDYPSMPVNRVYNDIQRMMQWGADGVKADNCNNPNNPSSETNNYYARYFRTMNQAIADYYQLAAATNGICREFQILNTGSTGEGWPNSFNEDSASGTSVQSFQPYVMASGLQGDANLMARYTNMVWACREAVTLFRPWVRPGHLVYHGFGVYGHFPGNIDNPSYGFDGWTNVFALHTAACMPVEVGLGSGWGTFDSSDLWSTTYWPGIQRWMTNSEVIEMLRDPLVIPAKITMSNEWVEVWTRPLNNGDTCLVVSSLATTNRTVTLNAYHMGIRAGQSYTQRDPWGRTDLSTFTNSLTVTQTPRSASLFRLVKATSLQTVDSFARRTLRTMVPIQGLAISGTGATKTSIASQGVSPFFNNDGINQSGANNLYSFCLPIPFWATNVTTIFEVFTSFAGGNVYHTVTPYLAEYYPNGRTQTQQADTGVLMPTQNVAVFVTNSFNCANTNIAKDVIFNFNASTNTGNRFLIGPLNVTFTGP